MENTQTKPWYKWFITGIIAFVLLGGVALSSKTHSDVAGISTYANPTPTPTVTIKLTPTSTLTPTVTQKPTPIVIPTATPTPKPLPTLTPTPRPTIYVAPQTYNTQTQPTSSTTTQTGLSNDNYYTNSAGNEVHSPAYSNDGSVPVGATAICGDGTYSFSQSHRGTCSHHGGVSKWL